MPTSTSSQRVAEASSEGEANAYPYVDERASIIDMLIVILKHKSSILRFTAAVAVCSAVVSFVLPSIYTAQTKILPPQQSQSLSTALLGQFGPLAGLAGSNLGLRNPNDVYLAMLKSRTVAEQIVQRFDLKKEYGQKYMADAVDALDQATTITSAKDGIITVEVDDRDPKKAAELANAYIEELTLLTQSLAVTEAAQRRLFFENQLKGAKEDLSKAEMELKSTQESTGLIQPESQSKAIIESVAQVQGQIAVKEVQLGSMRSFATPQNPDMVRTEQELAALRGQLLKLQRGKSVGRGDIQVATENVPEAGLAYLRKYRDVKYYETIFEVLAKQYELAKIDESKSAAIIQVMDKAIQPQRKSRPKRSLIVLIASMIAALFSTLYAFLKEGDYLNRSNPATQRRMSLLRHHFFAK